MATIGLSGGRALEAKLKQISEKSRNAAEVRVGFLAGQTYPDGTSLPMVAAIQEFGAPKKGIPPRPFIRNMIAKESSHWGDDVGKFLVEADYDATVALTGMGKEIQEEMQDSIKATNDPPLSPVTLMLREMRHQNPSLVVTQRTVNEARARVAAGKSYSGAPTKPLIDTAFMYQHVEYEVT